MARDFKDLDRHSAAGSSEGRLERDRHEEQRQSEEESHNF